ncbi:MAG: hypothetical protein Ct9H90mP5_00340 [Acidimicrobiaceae bacterium]|nr:MAG: hypothetical protein Ct9H90mP5_00340 [Acidimicrobiaceae bacterium]
MLKLVGRVADGTVTWMTGPETIRNHISPIINAAAEEAGRPVPQVIAAVPVCITSDLDIAEEYAKRDFGFYGDLPSYRAMLEREGLANSWDIALSGVSKKSPKDFKSTQIAEEPKLLRQFMDQMKLANKQLAN